MRKNDDKRNTGHRFISCVLLGAVCGLICAVFLFMIFALLISSGKVPESMMPYITVFAALAGATIGSVVTVKRYKAKLMLGGLAVGGVMFALTLIGSAISDNSSLFGSMTPILMLAFICGGVFGSLLNLNKKKHKHV